MNAVLELIRQFPPVHHRHIYDEFKVLEICGPFLVQNHVLGTDLGGQRDLFEICVSLLGKNNSGGFVVNTSVNKSRG